MVIGQLQTSPKAEPFDDAKISVLFSSKKPSKQVLLGQVNFFVPVLGLKDFSGGF